MAATPAPAQVLSFSDLDGWRDDDQLAALASFRATCDLLDAPEWGPLCKLAADIQTAPQARDFFELMFRPVIVGDPPALFTGYYEPELDGSPVRTPRFAYPIYAKPPELQNGTVWHSRAVIEGGILRGRGLEIAWLDDPAGAARLGARRCVSAGRPGRPPRTPVPPARRPSGRRARESATLRGS